MNLAKLTAAGARLAGASALAFIGCADAPSDDADDASLQRRDATGGVEVDVGAAGSGGNDLVLPDAGPVGGAAGGQPAGGGGGGGASGGGAGELTGGTLPTGGTDSQPADGAAGAAHPADAGSGGTPAPDAAGCRPAAEVCNGQDDDCDGEIDEMFLGTGEACETGLAGLCARGVQRCEAGALTCRGVEPGLEVCDNQDNDCDGQTDEEDGAGGVCHCQGGAPQLALAPVCDGGDPGSTHVGLCAPGAELHFFSVYESAGPGEVIDVRLARTGAPLALVLSSYEPVTWVLHVDEGVQIQTVVLNGYNPQVVQNVPDGAQIIDRSGVGIYFSACGYFWPMNDGGCDTPALVQGGEMVTGLQLTSFQGCYGALSFSLANL